MQKYSDRAERIFLAALPGCIVAQFNQDGNQGKTQGDVIRIAVKMALAVGQEAESILNLTLNQTQEESNKHG